jgi:hypothetical protein
LNLLPTPATFLKERLADQPATKEALFIIDIGIS